MDRLLNAVMDLVVPPASMVMLAFAWPTRGVKTLTKEDMLGKVVVITGASSAIGEQIAYEYARRNANLVLVARREHRLFGIRDNARQLGARQVLVIAADVVKEDDCRRLVADTVSYFGQLNPSGEHREPEPRLQLRGGRRHHGLPSPHGHQLLGQRVPDLRRAALPPTEPRPRRRQRVRRELAPHAQDEPLLCLQ